MGPLTRTTPTCRFLPVTFCPLAPPAPWLCLEWSPVSPPVNCSCSGPSKSPDGPEYGPPCHRQQLSPNAFPLTVPPKRRLLLASQGLRHQRPSLIDAGESPSPRFSGCEPFRQVSTPAHGQLCCVTPLMFHVNFLLSSLFLSLLRVHLFWPVPCFRYSFL